MTGDEQHALVYVTARRQKRIPQLDVRPQSSRRPAGRRNDRGACRYRRCFDR